MPCPPDHVEGKGQSLVTLFSTIFSLLTHHCDLTRDALDDFVVVDEEGKKNDDVEGCCRLVLKLPLLQTNHILKTKLPSYDYFKFLVSNFIPFSCYIEGVSKK